MQTAVSLVLVLVLVLDLLRVSVASRAVEFGLFEWSTRSVCRGAVLERGAGLWLRGRG